MLLTQSQSPVSTEPDTPLTIGNPQALTTTTPHHLRHHDTTTSMAATPKPFADYHVLFKKGSQVEVSLNEPGLVGSWYTATVLRPISYRTNLIHVRYDTLLSDGSKADEEIPLEESVHAVNVRPVPPRGKERQKFRVDEDVDAFDEDGWWEGVVVGVLKGGKYEVYFRCSREQMVFGGSELRVHREWVKGEWVPPVSEEEEEEEEELVGVETRLTRSSARKRKAQGAATEEKGGASSSGKGKHKELQLRKKVVPLLQLGLVCGPSLGCADVWF